LEEIVGKGLGSVTWGHVVVGGSIHENYFHILSKVY
jgi:hypothetical protein